MSDQLLSVQIEGHRTAVEAARVTILRAGPTATGLHGAAASCVDDKLKAAVAWMGRVAEWQREREAPPLDANWKPLGDVAAGIVDRLARGKPQ